MRIIIVNKQKGEEIGEINLQFLPRKEEHLLFKEKEFIVLNVIHNESYVVLDVFEKLNKTNTKFSQPTIHQY
jgi:hypothetical protein